VTSKLIKTPIKMGEKINCTEGAVRRYVKKKDDGNVETRKSST
jgi:hypothetical protein